MLSKTFGGQRRRAKVRGLAAIALATGSLALVAQKSQAQEMFWDPTLSSTPTAGGAGTWDLNTTSNWYSAFFGNDGTWTDTSGGAQVANFGGTAGAVALATNVGAVGLVFTTGGYSITGGSTITLGSTGIDTSTISGSTVINPNLTLVNGPQTWTNGSSSSLTLNGTVDNGGNSIILNNAGTTTFNGAISGSGGMTVTNTGTTIITAVANYSGSTWAQASTLQIGAIGGSAPDNILPQASGTAPSVVLGIAASTNNAGITFNDNDTIQNLYVIGNNSNVTHTITIASGKTLSIGASGNQANTSGAVALGSAISNADTTNVVFTGGGNLSINTGSNVTIGEPGFASIAGSVTGDADLAVVDMRGLASLSGYIGTLHIGDNNTANNSGTSVGGSTLYLPAATTIFTGRTDIENGSAGATDVLRLGSGASTLSIVNLFIGAGDINGAMRSNGQFVFDTSSGTLSLTSNAIDMSSYATFYANAISTSANVTSLFDVSGHQATINIVSNQAGISLAFRRGSSNPGGANSTFSFGGPSGAATSSLLNTPLMQMGERGGTTSGTETATVNLEGGTANIVQLMMAENNSTNNNGVVNANMNISAGNVSLTNVIMATTGRFYAGTNIAAATYLGTANAAINVSGGSVSIGAFNMATGDGGGAVSNGTLNITGSGSVAMGGNIVRSGIGNENTTITVNGTSGALLDLVGNAIGTSAAPIGNINVTAGTVQNVGQVYDSTMTIGTGKFAILNAVASNAVTNSVSTLSITDSGQLDLANSNLLTTTASSTVRQYLINGYNGGAWNGTAGITSVNAATNVGHMTALGYSSGTTWANLGLTAGQTLVKYTLYGDANLDGTVDITDLNTVLSNFLSGNPGTWDTGDFNYDGTTDISDLNTILSNYLSTAPTTVRTAGAKASASVASTGNTAHTLTGTASPSDNPAPGNGQLELIVNTNTGDVQIVGNNADIASLQITSASSGIITANWTDLHSQGYSNWADTAKKKNGIGEFDNQFTVSGDFALINGTIDYGNIYNFTANGEDYVFKYGSVESNGVTVDTDVGSVFYVAGVPEPTTLGLMGLAAAGLIGRRRRKEQK